MFHWQYMKYSSVVPKMDEFEGLKDKINELSLQSPEFWKTKVIHSTRNSARSQDVLLECILQR